MRKSNFKKDDDENSVNMKDFEQKELDDAPEPNSTLEPRECLDTQVDKRLLVELYHSHKLIATCAR